VVMSITMPWRDGPGEGQSMEQMFTEIDQALGILEAGLPL
jgi:hypothetical protein